MLYTPAKTGCWTYNVGIKVGMLVWHHTPMLPALLDFFSCPQPCSHHFCCQQWWYLAVIYLGTCFLIHPPGIYAIGLFHLCPCRQSAWKERKEIWLVGITAICSVCASWEVPTHSNLPSWQKIMDCAILIFMTARSSHIFTKTFLHAHERKQERPSRRSCSEL